MAGLGFRTVAEMIGRADALDSRAAIDHWKAQGIDLSRLLHFQDAVSPDDTLYCSEEQDHGLARALDNELISMCEPALVRKVPMGVGPAHHQLQPHGGCHAQWTHRQGVRRGRVAVRHHSHQFNRLGRPEFRSISRARS